MKDEKYPYNFIVPAAVLSIVFIGYRFAVSDQCIYIPIIRRILDKSLYPGDYLFDQPSGKYTILLPVLAYLSKLFTLRWVFFTGYVVVILALSWAIYKLAFAFFRNRNVACIALLLLCVSRQQDQAIVLQEGFFTIQPVAMPLSIMSIYFFIQDRYTLAYRAAEARQVMNWIKAGQSGSIIGLRGAGKSNFTRFLLRNEVRQHYLGGHYSDFTFALINLLSLAKVKSE